MRKREIEWKKTTTTIVKWKPHTIVIVNAINVSDRSFCVIKFCHTFILGYDDATRFDADTEMHDGNCVKIDKIEFLVKEISIFFILFTFKFSYFASFTCWTQPKEKEKKRYFWSYQVVFQVLDNNCQWRWCYVPFFFYQK